MKHDTLLSDRPAEPPGDPQFQADACNGLDKPVFFLFPI